MRDRGRDRQRGRADGRRDSGGRANEGRIKVGKEGTREREGSSGM